jgi:D-lactate dehydrogenase
MPSLSLAEELLQLLPAECVKTKLADLVSYASDAGFYQLVPQAVVLPRHEADIVALLALSARRRLPLVFRAGGTSLSGQSITDGILVDVSRHWRHLKVDAAASCVTVGPGLTGGLVNHYLKKYGLKIGPDPASINAAMMGGILSNNASGMCCGVAYNSYHTLRTLRFILPDGQTYDTARPDDYARFLEQQPQLCQTLLGCRQALLDNTALHDKIRRKYRTKNTVGYSLNALLDYTHPLDIFSHLLIGAEGTLAFIAEATLLAIPDKPCKAAAMLYFPSIYEACSAIGPLKATGVEALELMDRASLRSVEHLPGLPAFFKDLPEGAAALLCEYQATDEDSLQQLLAGATPLLATLPLLQPAAFTSEEKERSFYWKLRKGMFPSVGAVRQRGTTVILEDIAVPVERLADAVLDLQALFAKYDYHNAIIFGHAKDGNIHFVITQLLDTEAEIQRYDRFMREVVALVLHKYDGALKGEHGTGRNMAPFVEAEWGGEAYAIMQRIKAAADPGGLLNPGVIINASAQAHIEHLKDLPQVEEEVDKCIECGFCEINCPSRDLSMTPRRRIVARRALQRFRRLGDTQSERQLLAEYQYEALDTCATDGLCATECPVDINTGELVKRLRHEQHGSLGKAVAGWLSRHYGFTEKMVRGGIGLVAWVNSWFGWQMAFRISRGLRRVVKGMPVWMNSVRAAPRLTATEATGAKAVFFSSCINRVMQHGAEASSLQQILLKLSAKAGKPLYLPADLHGFCCGQPFSSKGFFEAGQTLLQRTIDQLLAWSDNGRLPIVCDFSSCTYTFLQQGKHLPAAYRQKLAQLQLVDSVAWLAEEVVPHLPLQRGQQPVVLHPTCAVIKLGLPDALKQIAAACTTRVTVPAQAGCCGMAGDRGFLLPELIAAATAGEAAEARSVEGAAGYASATTCEIALSQQSGVHYRHVAYLVQDALHNS